MKIAITSTSTDPEGLAETRFGRAPYFCIYDTEKKAWESLDNGSASEAHGAGIQTAQTLSRLGVNVVLTGMCGPNAFQTLKAAGMDLYTGIEGSVSQALRAYQDGALSKASEPNAKGSH